MSKYKIIGNILKLHKSFKINQELSIMDNGKSIWVIIGLVKTTCYFITIEFLNSENYKVHHQGESMFMQLPEEPISVEVDEEIRAIIIETRPDVYTIFNTKGVAIMSHITYEIVKEYSETVKNHLL